MFSTPGVVVEKLYVNALPPLPEVKLPSNVTGSHFPTMAMVGVSRTVGMIGSSGSATLAARSWVAYSDAPCCADLIASLRISTTSSMPTEGREPSVTKSWKVDVNMHFEPVRPEASAEEARAEVFMTRPQSKKPDRPATFVSLSKFSLS
jgi:hypothetical protein